MSDPHEKARLEANKRMVERLMELLINPATSEQARDLMTPEYIQHNPNLPDGRDAIISLASTDIGKQAQEFMKIGGPAKFVAEDDHVVMIQPIIRPDPNKPGQTYTLYWFDMWRIENGKIAEHWDAAPKEPWSMRDTSN